MSLAEMEIILGLKRKQSPQTLSSYYNTLADIKRTRVPVIQDTHLFALQLQLDQDKEQLDYFYPDDKMRKENVFSWQPKKR